MSLKLIIFDLDGTLVDTAPDIQAALNHALAPRGLPAIALEDTKAFIGDGVDNLIRRTLGPRDGELHDGFKEDLLAYYHENLTELSRVYPGVRETLKHLKSYRLAVLSNKLEAFSVRVLKNLDLAGFFDRIIGTDTTSARKPSPAPVHYVLDAFGVKPREALMVGDSPQDVTAAHAAGLRCVAVTYGYRERELLEDADFVLNDFPSLISLLIELKELDERRRAPRLPMPVEFRQSVNLRFRVGQDWIDTEVLDLSRFGIMFQSAVAVGTEAPLDLRAHLSKEISGVVDLSAQVRHCSKVQDGYITGVEMEAKSEETWSLFVEKIIAQLEAHGD